MSDQIDTEVEAQVEAAKRLAHEFNVFGVEHEDGPIDYLLVLDSLGCAGLMLVRPEGTKTNPASRAYFSELPEPN